MVGRGEVDEDLEGETKEECEKYGKVVKCVIFEVSEVNEAALFVFMDHQFTKHKGHNAPSRRLAIF